MSTDLYTEDQRQLALALKTAAIRYTQPVLSGDACQEFATPDSLFIPRVDPDHPFYTYFSKPFSLARYRFPTPPIELGDSRLSFGDNQETHVNVLRMPLKFPGTQFKIPVELAWCADLIERAMRYEASFNPDLDDCFVHVTVDDSVVEEDSWHRYPGFHGDGVQGAKFSQKELAPIEHSYILVSDPGTEFCIQPYFVEHLNDARHNLFHEFEKQSRADNIYQALPWHVYLIDPYMVHRTPPIKHRVRRVFVRITVAFTELQHPKNTLNPLFPDSGQYAARIDIRDFLSTYPGDVPYEMYGLLRPQLG